MKSNFKKRIRNEFRKIKAELEDERTERDEISQISLMDEIKADLEDFTKKMIEINLTPKF
jgi:hypothetical protein